MPRIDLSFTGGLNLRDSLEEIAQNETPDALNSTLTVTGAARPRAGCTQVATLPAGTAKFLYYSSVLNKWFCQVGTVLYVRPGDLSGSWASHLTGVQAGLAVAMVDFDTVAVIAAEGLGIYTTDGVTPVLVTSSVTGHALAVFKNRVWLANSVNATVYFSAIGNPASIGASDFVQVREKDAKGCTGFGFAQAGGLILYKRESAYRITDAATGAYTTIDWSTGCVAPQAATNLRGFTYTWAADGLYAWDGLGPGVLVGDKVRPRFLSNTASDTARAKVCGAPFEDRVVFAYPVDAESNNRFLELYPRQQERTDYLPAAGWVMEHQLAQAGEKEIAFFAIKGGKLYAAVSDGAAMYEMLGATPGADDGTNYTAHYKTPPMSLGKLSRLQRVRVYGKSDAAATSTKEIRTYKDWSASVAATFDITADFESADGAEVADLQALGHGEAFQLEFRAHSGTGTAELDRLLLDLDPLER